MRIAVMGTGGTGGYYGGLLARQKHEVIFIARGAHLQAIKKDGLQIKSVFGDFTVKPARATDKPAEVGPVELVLFCTKTYDTDSASHEAMPLVGAGTTVLSLQNGLDAHERIGEVVGAGHMLAGVTSISSAVEAPGIIKQVSSFRRVVLGELDGRETPRVRSIYEAFKGTGIDAEISANIMSQLWTKLAFIAVAAGFGSLTRLPMAGFRSVPETRALMTRLIQETAALAAADRVSLAPEIVENTLATVDNVGPQIKASMQLDVEAGHRSELEAIIGVLCQKGRALGVPTPVADMLYALLLPRELVTQST